MGLNTIFNKIYQTKLFRIIDAEVNGKINNKLNKFIQPVNLAIAENAKAIAEVKTILESAITENRNTLNEIKNRLNTYPPDALYHTLHSCLYPSFETALRKIVGDEHQALLQHAHLLLLEITKDYMDPWGSWQLAHKISGFTSQPAISTKRTHSAQKHLPSNRLKILIVSGMFPCIEHGGGLRLFDIVSLLAERHDIDLFSVFIPELDQHSHGLLQGRLKQTKLVCYDDFNQANLLAWLASLDRLPEHYDVIQCEYPYSSLLIETVRPFGKKIGFTFMESATKSALIKLENSLAENDFQNLGNLARSFWEIAVIEQKAARHTDFQIAVTPEDAEFIKQVSGVKPYVIPTCLSPSEVIDRVGSFENLEPEGETVVFLGYFDHYPNLDGVKWYLEKIHQEIKRQVPGYRFLVVGSGDTSTLQQISGTDSTVVYTGRVDDIVPYIMRGKVCILPLISGAGIRGKLNQYSIAGRPSVSTTIGNLGLNYIDGEAVLIADEPQAFATAVVTLLTDDALNKRIAYQSKAYAESLFTWERHIDRLVEIYRE